MTDNQLNYLAYNYLTEHIFECEERLKKNTSDSVVKQLKQRIEVYEYLIKLTGGMVIENDR